MCFNVWCCLKNGDNHNEETANEETALLDGNGEGNCVPAVLPVSIAETSMVDEEHIEPCPLPARTSTSRTDLFSPARMTRSKTTNKNDYYHLHKSRAQHTSTSRTDLFSPARMTRSKTTNKNDYYHLHKSRAQLVEYTKSKLAYPDVIKKANMSLNAMERQCTKNNNNNNSNSNSNNNSNNNNNNNNDNNLWRVQNADGEHEIKTNHQRSNHETTSKTQHKTRQFQNHFVNVTCVVQVRSYLHNISKMLYGRNGNKCQILDFYR